MPALCFLPSQALVRFLRPSIVNQRKVRHLSHAHSVSHSHLRLSQRALTSGTLGASSRRHIVLLSGGVESSTLLHLAASEGDAHITALFFDYGQRAAAHELRASKAQCADVGVSDFLRLDLRAVSSSFLARSHERRHVPLHHRNGVLLSLALSLAGQEDASRVSVAVCADDAGWYASASPGFLTAFRGVGQALDGVSVEAPLEMMSKAEVVRRGGEMGVEWERTWSCMIGRGEKHCGRCGQCRARRKAFQVAGVEEVEGFYMR